MIKVFKSQAVCIHSKEYKQEYKVETNGQMEEKGTVAQPFKLSVFSRSKRRWWLGPKMETEQSILQMRL